MYPGIVDPRPGASAEGAEYLYVSLGNLCNAHCEYCDVHEAPKAVRKPQSIDVQRVLREAAGLGVRHVHFMGGGEPLVEAQFEPAVACCNRLGLGVVLTTNGSHLARRLDGALGAAALEAVFVSLDSHVAEDHDRVRGHSGLFAKATRGVELTQCLRPSARVVINHVVTRRNIGALREFLAFAGQLGASAVNLIPVKDRYELTPEGDQWTRLSLSLGSLRATARTHGLSLLCEDGATSHWLAHAAGSTATGRRSFRCFFPQRALYVDFSSGGVFPCDCTVHRAGETDFCIGNIWQASLQSIWTGAKVRSLRSVLESTDDPGCKLSCDWSNVRTNGLLGSASLGRPGG